MLTLSPSDNYRVRLLITGGSGAITGGDTDFALPATATAEQFDFGQMPLQWRGVASMNFRRVLQNLRSAAGRQGVRDGWKHDRSRRPRRRSGDDS